MEKHFTELFPSLFSNITVVAWGTKSVHTQILKFLDTCSEKEVLKIVSILHSVDDAHPLKYQNEHKFKNFNGKLYEIKEGQIRIGCYLKENTWILIYGFRKKTNAWTKKDRDNFLRIYKDCKDVEIINKD